MVANRLYSLRFLPLVALACASAPVAAQSYDNDRAQLVASQPGQAAAAVARWKQLTGSSRMDSAELVDDLFHAVYEFGVLDGQAQVSAVADPVQGRAHDGATCS